MMRVNSDGMKKIVVSLFVGDEKSKLTSGMLSVPNAITLARLCMLPIFLYVLFGRDNRAAAAWLLGAISYTDWIDGWVARKLNQTSVFGSVFDPFVDRVLFIVATIGVMIDGGVPSWFCIVIMVREIAIGGAMLIGTMFGMQRFAVSYWGKWYTLFLMTSVPLLLLGSSTSGLADGATLLGWIFAVPGLTLSYYTAVMYVPVIRANLRAGRLG